MPAAHDRDIRGCVYGGNVRLSRTLTPTPSRTFRGRARLVLMALLAGLLAACADAAQHSTDHSPAHTVTSFRADYLASEKAYRSDFEHLQAEARTVIGQPAATQLKVFTKMYDATSAAVMRFEALVPPIRLRATYANVIVSLKSQQLNLRSIGSNAARNDDSALNSALTDYAESFQNGISLLRQMDDALHTSNS